MARKRPAKGLAPKVRITPEVRAAFVALGRIGGLKGGAKGGKTTASRRTPEERRAAMKKALDARWAKVRAKKKAKEAKQAESAVPTTKPAASGQSPTTKISPDRWKELYG